MIFDDFPLKPYLDDSRLKILSEKAIEIFDFANTLRKKKIEGEKLSNEEAEEFSKKIEHFRIMLRSFKDTEFEEYLPHSDDDFDIIFKFIEELAVNTLYKMS